MNLLKDTEGTQLLGICKVLRVPQKLSRTATNQVEGAGARVELPSGSLGRQKIHRKIHGGFSIAISVPKGYPTMEIPRCFPSWFPHRQASIQFLPGFGCSAEMAMFTRIPFATPVGLTNQQQQHFLLTCQATFNNITTSDKDTLW